ncbi:MAG: Histidine kinase protein [Magnetococcales bacterium]|nr:Histidine kinase protein [Magnetococcales bacterium]HIJ85268.1 HAMP domain-containing histidine kinase [Magnetococcales bacterium]
MIKAKLNSHLRNLPLALKAVLLTTSLSLVLWIVIDHFHHWNMEKIVNNFSMQELQQRTSVHWGRLDTYIRSQSQVAQLLVQRQAFLDYLNGQWDRKEGDAGPVVPVRHRDVPPWLPDRTVLQELLFSPHWLLLDPQGKVREIYRETDFDSDLPESLTKELTAGIADVKNVDSIRLVDKMVYLVTHIKVVDSSASLRAFLVLVTPLDDTFLMSVQAKSNTNDIIIFLEAEGQYVSASSHPGVIPTGTAVAALRKKYILNNRTFLDCKFSVDSFVRMASLVPLSRVDELSQSVAHVDRSLRTIGFAVLLFLFFGIIQWLVWRIRALTQEILIFSKQHLGSEPVRVLGRDQLMVMGDQLRLMMAAIVEFREHLREREQELTLANKSLWESLVMVKRTQSKLLESEKMAYLGGLVAGVAHEINTPVGIGITAASFLEKKCRDVHVRIESGELKKSELVSFIADARESSEMVLNNLQRAAELIRSFKQVAVDQSSEEKRNFNFCQYIQQIFKSLQPRLKKTRIQISTDCPDNLEYNGFPGALSQIVTNLVENSLKHGFDPDEPGEIHLRVDMLDDNIRLVYSDTGRGIAKDVISHIFEPFFTTARNKGGSGLGLHIVYNLTTQTLGGSIQCESSPGKGVRFMLVFPGTGEVFHE